MNINNQSLKRSVRRHVLEDYGMSFKTMIGLAKIDPMELLYRLNRIDEEKVTANRERRKNRKNYEKKSTLQLRKVQNKNL